jgi:hypothetical protein
MRKLQNNKKKLLIYLWMTNWKKKYPQKTFKCNDINSGSTSYWISGPKSNLNGTICIWRKEELLKVLVHELIHSFHIDKYDPLPKEAYVELRAVMANIYLELLERNIPVKEYSHYLKKEQEYGKRMCKSIRKYNNGKTNIRAYLDVRNRMLNNTSPKEWDVILNSVTEHPGKNIKFTITEELLDKRKKRVDGNGKILIIP